VNTVSLRGMGPLQMERAAALIDEVLSNVQPRSATEFDRTSGVKERVIAAVSELCRSFPLPWDKRLEQPRWLETVEAQRPIAGVIHA
jgi:glycine/serine hydroxymethyltransferase